MNQEIEKIVECAVLTFVGLLALAAILVFLPDANARSIYLPVKAGASVVMTASTLLSGHSVRTM